MGKDLDPSTTPTAEATDGKPFVRVFREKGTGNVIIALDAEAMDGMLTILDAADLKEMHDNPSYLGMDAETGDLAASVGYDILGQLRGLDPYLY
jgi:hypothetical protein